MVCFLIRLLRPPATTTWTGRFSRRTPAWRWSHLGWWCSQCERNPPRSCRRARICGGWSWTRPPWSVGGSVDHPRDSLVPACRTKVSFVSSLHPRHPPQFLRAEMSVIYGSWLFRLRLTKRTEAAHFGWSLSGRRKLTNWMRGGRSSWWRSWRELGSMRSSPWRCACDGPRTKGPGRTGSMSGPMSIREGEGWEGLLLGKWQFCWESDQQ